MIKILKFPLTFVSFLWSTLYSIRRYRFMMKNSDAESLAPPVISVGNIAFGGTGKTPFIIWLATILQELNKEIIVATRGYKSQMEGRGGMMTFPSKTSYSAKEFGDEPVLIGENIKKGRIVVGKERFNNLRRFLKDDEKDSVVLLDDGFQHLMLNRDLNIVLFDATLPLDRYHCPPQGYLREGLGSLKDADIIAIGRVDLVQTEQLQKLEAFLKHYTQKNILFIHFNYEGKYLSDVLGKKVAAESHKWFAFSGIASPDGFIESLGQMGCNIVDKKIFPDHFNYSLENLTQLKNQARELGAKLVCTEKDAVKFKELDSSLELYYLKIVVQITHGEDALLKTIKDVISY